MLANLLLDVIEVHAVCTVLEEKRARDELAPIALDDAEKRIVDGFGYENGIIRRGKCTHRHGEREDDARRHDEGIPARIPAMARAEPLFERPIVVLFRTRIAEDAVLGASANGITHRLRRTKVHVGDPERQNVLGIAALDGEVVFEAVRMAALDDFIKVEMVHGRSLLFLWFRGKLSSLLNEMQILPRFLFFSFRPAAFLSLQGLLQISLEVFDILDADGEAQEFVVESRAL